MSVVHADTCIDYQKAIEAAWPGVTVEQLETWGRDDDLTLWVSVSAPEAVLVGSGLVRRELLNGLHPKCAGRERGGLRFTRRKRWTRIQAQLLDRHRPADALDRFETLVLAAMQPVYWAGPKTATRA